MSRPGPIGRVAWALACLVALVVAVSTPRLGRADDGAPRTTSRPAPASKGPVAARTSPVLFPLERRTVTFEHRQHGPELDLGCTDCHAAARTSRRASDLLLPAGTACDRCHGTDHRQPSAVIFTGDRPPKGCGACHELLGEAPDRVAPHRYPAPRLRFDHAAHEQRNIGCAQCHGSLDTPAGEGRAALPSMRRCATCHLAPGEARGDASSRCTTCHLTAGGVMRTDFPTGQLLPPRWLGDAQHGPDFARHHAAAAAANSRFCANCHRESECAACHDGRVRPRRLHPNDWLSLHGRAAELGSPRCTGCHREQSFCLGCHQRLGVAQTAPTGATGSRGRYHPPSTVWTDSPAGRGHHSWAARRNLDACIGCHVERDCVSCHATASRGGAGSGIGHRANPHGAGFRRRCGAALRKNPRPCLLCHDPDDPELATCR
jgi:hypothetical protein